MSSYWETDHVDLGGNLNQKKKKIGSMASCRKYPWGNIVVNSAEKRKKRNLQWKELRIGLFKQHYTRAVTEKKIK